MKRQSKRLASSLEHRLNSYALAASVAGVGVLALTQPAEAKIVYTPAHVIIGHGGVWMYQVDLNHDGVSDVTFGTVHSSSTSLRSVDLWAGIPRSNGVQAQRGIKTWVSALRRGAWIGIGPPLRNCPGFLCAMASSATGISSTKGGQWRNVKNRYVGMRFVIRGKSHFGWIRLSVSMHAPRVTATLTGYAYETIPGKPIITGKTKGPDVITLPAATLGHLARGASGLSAWRGGK
jgi:hypothetical protein